MNRNLNQYQRNKQEFLTLADKKLKELEIEAFQLRRNFDEARTHLKRMSDDDCFSASGVVNHINRLAAKAQYLELELTELKELLLIKIACMYRSKD